MLRLTLEIVPYRTEFHKLSPTLNIVLQVLSYIENCPTRSVLYFKHELQGLAYHLICALFFQAHHQMMDISSSFAAYSSPRYAALRPPRPTSML